MKSISQIKKAVKKGDYTTAARIIGISPELVKKIVSGERTDHHDVQKVLSQMLEHREKLAIRLSKTKMRQAA